MFSTRSIVATLLVLVTGFNIVNAHCLITNIKGANGINAVGVGVTKPSGKAIELAHQAPRWLKGTTQVCGQNRRQGGTKFLDINWRRYLSDSVSSGLPSADSEGVVTMTIMQINRDGAGPFKCEVSTDASGKNFQPMKIRKQVPGSGGKSNKVTTPFTLRAQLPSGIKCTGSGGACLVRCQNAVNQPFGGCAVVTTNKNKKRGEPSRISERDEEYPEVFEDEL